MAGKPLLKSLIDWVTGGVSTRLDFVERDLQSLEARTERLSQTQQGMARAVLAHEDRLNAQERQLAVQGEQMIALRKMHGVLANRLGRPFPGRTCPQCEGPMIFDRLPAENAYTLQCESRCSDRLLLPESNLLETFRNGGV